MPAGEGVRLPPRVPSGSFLVVPGAVVPLTSAFPHPILDIHFSIWAWEKFSSLLLSKTFKDSNPDGFSEVEVGAGNKSKVW